jgi:hypothetical protein
MTESTRRKRVVIVDADNPMQRSMGSSSGVRITSVPCRGARGRVSGRLLRRLGRLQPTNGRRSWCSVTTLA